MAKLAIRPQALSDLDDIFDYIAEDSLNRAAGFIKKLYEQMGKVADNPGIGQYSSVKHFFLLFASFASLAVR